MERLGRAITAWGLIEGVAYDLYSLFMRGANQKLMSVSFFHIQSFESRIQLLDRCAHFAIQDKTTKDRWKNLRKRITDHAGVRNQLVHSAYIIEGRGEVQIPTLGPSHMDATAIVRGRAMNPEYRIDAGKLGRIRYDFERLARDFREFKQDLEAMVS